MNVHSQFNCLTYYSYWKCSRPLSDVYSFVDLTLRVLTVSKLTLRRLKSWRRLLLREKLVSLYFLTLRLFAPTTFPMFLFSSFDGCKNVNQLEMFWWEIILSEHPLIIHSFTSLGRRKSHKKSHRGLKYIFYMNRGWVTIHSFNQMWFNSLWFQQERNEIDQDCNSIRIHVN